MIGSFVCVGVGVEIAEGMQAFILIIIIMYMDIVVVVGVCINVDNFFLPVHVGGVVDFISICSIYGGVFCLSYPQGVVDNFAILSTGVWITFVFSTCLRIDLLISRSYPQGCG